ncbi:MAG: hypothetical protein IPO08_21275 [Xanthomonadales bacterium]|nr:hypothetical protein [Xanthomonadales bacterium]
MGIVRSVKDLAIGGMKLCAKAISKTAEYGNEHRDTIASTLATTTRLAGTAVKVLAQSWRTPAPK